MRTFIALLLIGSLRGAALNAALLFDGGAPSPNAGAVASNFAGHDPEYELQSADTFILATAANLTQVRWWGAYQGSNIPLNPDLFTVRIFADAAGVPALMPLAEYHLDRVKRAMTRETSGGLDIYEYVALLKPHHELPAGRYWISIVNDVLVEETATDWLWILANNAAGDYAFRFSDGTAWLSPLSFTLAFQIFGNARPAR